MMIDLQDITDDGLHLSFEGTGDVLSKALAEVPPSEGVSIDPAVTGELHLFKTGENFTLTGTIHAGMRLHCARCLKEFSTGRTIALAFLIRQGTAGETMEDDSLQAPENEIVVDGTEVDLAAIIYQEILLEVPMQPLCSESCPGLCPICGALKGSDECKCPAETVADPRWEALARLREKMPP